MTRLIGIYGASGFGREVMGMLSAKESLVDNMVFIDDGSLSQSVNGYSCMSWNAFLEAGADDREVALAVADSEIRQSLASKCENENVKFYSAVADNAIVLDCVDFAEGIILCPFSIITSNVKIGRHFHANIYSYVAHDCRIGDFVTFAPGVKCNGNVIIEDHAYIGTGAILRQGKPGDPLVIGKGAIVGMGAVVTKNVPAGATVVGNPARLLEKN